MKIRILDNAIRIRLSKSEVSQLAENGMVKSSTFFIDGTLTYSLVSQNQHEYLEASYSNHSITILAPENFLKAWPNNNVVGMESRQQTALGQDLYLLIEKDFKCLDNSSEDQSDNFENPNKLC